DYLKDISATVNLLQDIKKQVGHALRIAYNGLIHASVDSLTSVWKVGNKINKLMLCQFNSK
ncbi:hypothetical protein BDR05DRAFT_893944, partial [Suillus weaverae]